MKASTIIVLTLACTTSMTYASPSDREIEQAAQSSYTFRQVLEDDVNIRVENGVATLTGTVESEADRRIAEDTVSALNGVRRVDNRLTVERDDDQGSDAWIATKVRGRLLVKDNVSLTDTDVHVENGVVTLRGIAGSQAQKDLTEAYVRDLEGVRQVNNQIRVIERKPAPIDESNQPLNLEEKEARRAEQRATEVETVRDDEAKIRREERNSTDLNDNRLRAEPRATRAEIDDDAERIDDSSLTAQIKSELRNHQSTRNLKTQIDTNGGRVVIHGEAANEAERDLVTKLAQDIRGVVSVENRMNVRVR